MDPNPGTENIGFTSSPPQVGVKKKNSKQEKPTYFFTIVIHFILLIAMIILILPVSFLLIQILAAILVTKSASTIRSPVIRPTIAVLMPAHNESLVIAQTVQSVLMQLSNQDQLLVVADNCSDDTAIIAKNLGFVMRWHQHCNRWPSNGRTTNRN